MARVSNGSRAKSLDLLGDRSETAHDDRLFFDLRGSWSVVGSGDPAPLRRRVEPHNLGLARRTLDPAEGASSSIKSDNYGFAGELASVI